MKPIFRFFFSSAPLLLRHGLQAARSAARWRWRPRAVLRADRAQEAAAQRVLREQRLDQRGLDEGIRVRLEFGRLAAPAQLGGRAFGARRGSVFVGVGMQAAGAAQPQRPVGVVGVKAGVAHRSCLGFRTRSMLGPRGRRRHRARREGFVVGGLQGPASLRQFPQIGCRSGTIIRRCMPRTGGCARCGRFVAENPKMPTLHWVGKEKVVNHHHEVPFRVLDKVSTFRAPEGAAGQQHRQPHHPRRQPRSAEEPAARVRRPGEVHLHRPALQHRQRGLGLQRRGQRPQDASAGSARWSARKAKTCRGTTSGCA